MTRTCDRAPEPVAGKELTAVEYRLSGRVEVDETYWGSGEKRVRGRQTESKALIVIAAQEDGAGVGRIRMRRIPDASAESLMPFIEEAIELAV